MFWRSVPCDESRSNLLVRHVLEWPYSTNGQHAQVFVWVLRLLVIQQRSAGPKSRPPTQLTPVQLGTRMPSSVDLQ